MGVLLLPQTSEDHVAGCRQRLALSFQPARHILLKIPASRGPSSRNKLKTLQQALLEVPLVVLLVLVQLADVVANQLSRR
mmetsp:Transcript_13185/g.32202  ORF Transcript_13185/g.32202 Transcript_13185/m.32202 type:complete len:80 (-) Transcript_13185:247-486(-)